jgi:hypothetical protein
MRSGVPRKWGKLPQWFVPAGPCRTSSIPTRKYIAPTCCDMWTYVSASGELLARLFLPRGSLFGEITMAKKMVTNRRTLLGVGLVVVLAAAPLSLHRSPTTALSLSFDTASARIGHPISPGSIAGVHRRVYRRTARRNYYGAGAAAVGAAAAYGVANQNYGYESGYSPAYNNGESNLYSYAPPTDQAAATNATQANEGGVGQNTTQPSLSPALYAACLDRTFGNCPRQ